jgi:tRNA (guanine26-N2/guanine27-N2)-dimethyltransferase
LVVVAEEAELKRQSVFYNPIQQFNRDISVLAIKAFGDDWMTRKRSRDERYKSKGNAQKASKKRKFNQLKNDEVQSNSIEDSSKSAKLDSAGDAAVEKTGTASASEGDVSMAEQTEKQESNGAPDAPLEQVQPVEDDGIAAPDAAAAASAPTPAPTNAPRGPIRFRILDALSATGLRALRYAKEIPFVTSVVANDMNPNAIKDMGLNITHNDLEGTIQPNLGDAIGHMYRVAYPPTKAHGPEHIYRKYDVIDLDPYGTAAPFLDAALQALSDGGLLCVTCTDSGVFASCGYSEKTYSLYGGMPVKGIHMHEGGLRLIINAVATSAARYGLAIEPLLSLNIDYYARTFIRVRKSPAEVKFLASKTMVVYGCDSGCGAWTTQRLGRANKQASANGTPFFKYSIAQAPGCDQVCRHCKNKTHIAGPMWAGPIHNAAFIEKVLDDLEGADAEVYQTKPRMEGMLSTALEELSVNDCVTQFQRLARSDQNGDGEKTPAPKELIPIIPPETIDHCPFFFNPSTLSKVVHCQAPSDAAIRGAIRGLGYRVTRSHCQPGSIKTNAPWTVIWEIMREWVRQHSPIREGAIRENSAGWHILQASRDVKSKVDDNSAPPDPTHETSNAANVASQANAAEQTPVIITETDQPHEKAPKPAANKAGGDSDIQKLIIVFDEALGRDVPKSGKRLIRYQMNPRENWGPMAKHKGSA